MVLKNIILIRHGQGNHNALFAVNKIAEARSLRDPPLNEKGIQQCNDLNKRIGFLLKSEDPKQRLNVDVVISSPMKRALGTTDHVFKGFNFPIEVSPLPTEMGDGPCDYGSNPSELSTLFPHHDLSTISDNWWPVDETDDEIQQRAERFKQYLLGRPEQNIAVVSHGCFLGFLTKATTRYFSFKNCELKSFQLDSELELVQSELNVKVNDNCTPN